MKNQNIVLTGSGSSFGQYLYQRLQEQGHNVFGVGLDGPDMKVDFLDHRNDADGLGAMIMKAANEHFEAPVACLINNAAITRIEWGETHSSAEFEQVLFMNLTVPFALCTQFMGYIFTDSDYGPDHGYEDTYVRPEHGMPTKESQRLVEDIDPRYRIINTSTMGAKIALRGSHGYCAAKAGLEMMTKVIAKENAGILPLMACCIRPNGLEGGGMTDYTLSRVCHQRGWDYDDAVAYNKNTPLGRLQEFEELWRIYDFAVNRAPVMVSGSVFDSPGGNGL